MTVDPLAGLVELPGVRLAADTARDAVDSLLGHRALRRRAADVSAESLLRGAWASAWLAGAEHELADVRSGAAANDPIVQGALRANSALAGLSDTWTRAPRQALARLHALAAADLVVNRDQLGRPGSAPMIAARLDALSDVLGRTSAPAVVVAAVLHGELLALDAFPPVSGLVARAAVRLTLIERGLDPRSLVIIEAGHRELAGQYASSLAAYRNGGTAGVTTWLQHCAAAVAAGAQEGIAICEALTRG